MNDKVWFLNSDSIIWKYSQGELCSVKILENLDKKENLPKIN